MGPNSSLQKLLFLLSKVEQVVVGANHSGDQALLSLGQWPEANIPYLLTPVLALRGVNFR